ncbi:MAG: hypothetical protein GY807_06900 [Gammaproteobacteria bacterium]|nr:hypothetical protein [Gammaproteobacteria bacterium]
MISIRIRLSPRHGKTTSDKLLGGCTLFLVFLLALIPTAFAERQAKVCYQSDTQELCECYPSVARELCECSAGFNILTGGVAGTEHKVIRESLPQDNGWMQSCIDLESNNKIIACPHVRVICVKLP